MLADVLDGVSNRHPSTNRQIYREAWGIFQFENLWTLVRINKAGFGNEMKDRDFPVMTVAADRPRSHAKFPVMKLTVTFPSLEDQKQSDVFLVSITHLNKLMRVLWTAKGASEMLVAIDVQPPRTKQSPSESQLLRPFFNLRSIMGLVILGVSKGENVDQLTRAITTTDGMQQVFSDLVANVQCLQRYIRTEQWGLASTLEREHLNLIMDCRTVYDIRFASHRAAAEINIATATSTAEIALHEKNYAWAICIAQRGLHLISRISVFFNPVNPTFTVPPYQQLLSPAGIIASEDEIKCKILLIRARAYMGIRSPYSSFRDIKKAREIMPNSTTVASVSEAWQGMFPAHLRLLNY
ncbi:hypothetical protein MMC22_008897 [Lobaria immixta]|nr:hypothetical protein [Lobaria immixta]